MLKLDSRFQEKDENCMYTFSIRSSLLIETAIVYSYNNHNNYIDQQDRSSVSEH